MKVLKGVLIIVSSLILLTLILTVVASAEKPLHPGYPYVFDMTGKVDRMSITELVVDDVLCRLTNNTTFHAFDNSFADAASFKVRDQVGLIFSDKERRVVLSVWLIKRAD